MAGKKEMLAANINSFWLEISTLFEKSLNFLLARSLTIFWREK
jgi:hypothetical protein